MSFSYLFIHYYVISSNGKFLTYCEETHLK